MTLDLLKKRQIKKYINMWKAKITKLNSGVNGRWKKKSIIIYVWELKNVK